MNAIESMIMRVRELRGAIDEELRAAVSEYSDIIIDMVANDQLYERGINGRGVEISSYEPYRMSTIRIKLKKGQPVDRVTLRDTGRFHRSFKLKTDAEGFYIEPTDRKTEMLKDRYGSLILRLSSDNVSELLRGYIRPYLVKRLKNHYL